MTNLKAIVLSIILIILNALFGHYLPPASIFLTPAIIGIITFLCGKTNIKLYFIVLFIIIAITSNDILIKLMAGGKNDFEGAGLINLIFLITVFISTVIVCSILVTKKKGQILKVMLFCILIPLTSYIYISYFDFLGLINYLNTSKSKEIAIKNKVFLNDLKFSINPIIYKNDTLKIVDGWSEKQIIVNHERLIKRYDDTSTINYTIKLKSNIRFDNLNMSYKVNDGDLNGSTQIDSTVSFNSLSSIHKITLYIFKITDKVKTDTVIAKIIILK